VIHRRTFLLTPLALAASRAAKAADPRPNVVLITGGVWRAQAVPWAKDADINAPNLARLASEGVTFSRAYACYAHSDRGRPCLTRGVFPHALPAPLASPDAAKAGPPTIDALLHNAGYRIGAFRGRQAGEIVTFVHAVDEAPFFVEWAMDGSGGAFMERLNPVGLHVRANVPPEAQSQARSDLALFYERAKTRDRDIGVVLAALDRPGLAENTVVVFTSQHGEQFFSHGVQGDDYPYEESIRIPLGIRYPRMITPGSQSDMLVSQVDLMPSLLSLCGVAIPKSVQGRDVSRLIFGPEKDRPDAVYAEGRLGMRNEWRMLVHGYDKLVTDLEGNVVYLYNLADDPLELTNLAEVTSAQLKRDELVAVQQIWKKRLADGVDASGLRTR
jgi:arylsulfatase A-like enzyme